MERERKSGHGIKMPPRPRPAGRGRRDPQAEEEDAFVEELREQSHAWKVVTEMFRQRFKKDASEARLQMRLSRRKKDRLARWDDRDVSMLQDHGDHARVRLVQEKLTLVDPTPDQRP